MPPGGGRKEPCHLVNVNPDPESNRPMAKQLSDRELRRKILDTINRLVADGNLSGLPTIQDLRANIGHSSSYRRLRDTLNALITEGAVISRNPP